ARALRPRRVGHLLLLGDTEIPFEDERLPFGVTGHPLAVAAELGAVGREQEEPGQRPLAELLDHGAFAKLGLHLPVRGHRTEVDDPDVPLRGPWSLELFGGLRHETSSPNRVAFGDAQFRATTAQQAAPSNRS